MGHPTVTYAWCSGGRRNWRWWRVFRWTGHLRWTERWWAVAEAGARTPTRWNRACPCGAWQKRWCDYDLPQFRPKKQHKNTKQSSMFALHFPSLINQFQMLVDRLTDISQANAPRNVFPFHSLYDSSLFMPFPSHFTLTHVRYISILFQHSNLFPSKILFFPFHFTFLFSFY